MTNKWIKKALRYHKKGALHKQLGISIEKNIPESLLVKIKTSNIGDKIYIRNYSYDTKLYGYIKVTPLLKKRAVLALNLRRLK